MLKPSAHANRQPCLLPHFKRHFNNTVANSKRPRIHVLVWRHKKLQSVDTRDKKFGTQNLKFPTKDYKTSYIQEYKMKKLAKQKHNIQNSHNEYELLDAVYI